jgi:hypothetical protein
VRAARDVGDPQIGVAAARDLAQCGILDGGGRTSRLLRALALHVAT